MKQFDAAIDRLFQAVAARATERGILWLAAVLYIGVGLALPLTLAWSVPWLVAANVFGTMLAFSFLMVWVGARVQESRRRNLLEWTTDLRRLDAREFEWLVGEVFRREGWAVEETGLHGQPDGGVDLILRKGRERAFVQSKRWTSWQVGVADVRSFAGTLTRDRLPSNAGFIVTLSDFTEQARLEGKKLGLTLLDGVDLYARVDKVRRPEPCPNCRAPMLLDRSPRGWWFRCTTPGCGGKRDLGRDPAQAVELLTQPPLAPTVSD
jgi:HJR/Mrr/RecB family endonuclease